MAVDNSSSSPSFRELDDVFLQSQARIWVEEVLHTRFDEQLSICDLLSDGELLFEVSKALWNMLLVKYMELDNFKSRMFISVDSSNRSGRYRPYSNVDSFLKVCKVLGLSGVDLFSPSDVVEKKDTRKVCICIRSLSKKARSKKLNVPDFDIVTKTVAMPTDVVKCIRRSLEISTSGITHGQNKHSRLKFRQKSSYALHKQEDESFVEESDKTKSNFSESSYSDFLYLESGDSPETVNKYALTQQSDNKNQEIDKFLLTPGSQKSLILQYVNTDNQLVKRESRLIICDDFTPINHSMCRISPTSSRVLDFDFDFDGKSELHGAKRLFSLCNESELEVLNLSEDSFSPCWDDAKSVDRDLESLNQISSNQENVVISKGSNDKGVKMVDLKSTYELVRCDYVYGYGEDRTNAAIKDERREDGIDCLVEANRNGKNNNMIVKKEKKGNYIAPIMKTVAKGTALIGILFFLHLRNSSDRNTNNKLSAKSSQIHWKSSGVGFSRSKGERGSKIYPVDKLKFGD